ncbi:Predicted arabinose efflux permease, MFS family [Paracoccus alcaliphilus]|uniref:Predicted arabinose efflux permease, MFS family n=2 Tax=Paracoccus alcaliphilus TaxID=34002 RepID=A0A1H8IFF4_9RHOB|nr:Predicted arabinose efflux permease, MFS family [Paracoccus alcaliphilus]
MAELPDMRAGAVPAKGVEGMMDPVLRDRRIWVLMAAAMLTIMSNATITPALPGLQQMFAANPDAALMTRLLITAPSLLVAITAPIAGSITDRIGRIRPLCWGLVLFSVAGTAGLYLGSLEAILASRLALGLGVACIMTAQAALIGDYYEGPVRARLMGYQMAAVNLGGLIFVTAAGAMAAHDPRLPFAIYGLGLILILPALRCLHEPARTIHDGILGEPRAPAEPGWQLNVGLMAVAAGATFVMYYAVPTQLPYLMASVGLDQPQQAGLVLGATMLAAAVLSVASGPLRRWLGRVGTPVTGFMLLAAGFWGMAEAQTMVTQMSFAALNGAGLGLTMPAFVTTALNVTPAHRRGTVSGIITSAIFLGQFLSPLATQPLVTYLGYSGAFHVAAVSYVVLGALLFLTMRRQPGSVPAHPPRKG